MLTGLILSGGPAHEYALTSPMLSDVLVEVGIDCHVHDEFTVVEDGSLDAYDLVVLNCARWTCDQTPEWRDEWHFSLSEAARKALLDFLDAGKGLLALHAATLCFDDWPEYRKILRAWWDWGHSGHAPAQPHAINVYTDAHPIVHGVEDFEIIDELYTKLRLADAIQPLADATWEGETHPILWTRLYGNARICYNALGHGVDAFDNPTNRLLIQRGALWVVDRLETEETSGQ